MHKLHKGEPSPRERVRQTMLSFKDGNLRSAAGDVVKNRKQAIAIALSQAGLSRQKSAPAKPALAKAAPAHRCAADERVAGMAVHAERILHSAGRVHTQGAEDPHVMAMVPHMRRLLGTLPTPPSPRSRLQNNAAVGDRRQSLTQIVA